MREYIVFITVALLVYAFLRKAVPDAPEESLGDESDLMCKMRWVTKHYHIETDPHQTLLTTCYRVRMNKTNIFIDLCDDFFAGFHTLTYDKDGRFIGEQFNAYHHEPCDDSVDESFNASGLPEGETILTVDPESDHFAQLRRTAS